MLDPVRLKALEEWQTESRVKLSQVNGQRKYGGPPDGWEGPVPGCGCEVFISQFPRETYEDRLIPLFSAVAPLWEFRLMMNFSGQNRGFAYAKYSTPAAAAATVGRLHGHELEPGVFLAVRHSTEKRQLCVGELPAATQWAELLRVLMNLTEGVEGLSLKSGPDMKGMSALVIYVSHHAASMAKKVLVEGFKKCFSLQVSVKWQHFNPKVRTPAVDGPRELPPRLRCPRPPGMTFNRAPGAPVALPPAGPGLGALTAPVSLPPAGPGLGALTAPVSLPPAGPGAAAPCALTVLNQLCEASCGAKPVMKLEFRHVDAGSRVYVTYEVQVPGLPRPFSGAVSAPLGRSTAGTLGAVRRLAAGQVLGAVRALAR